MYTEIEWEQERDQEWIVRDRLTKKVEWVIEKGNNVLKIGMGKKEK